MKLRSKILIGAGICVLAPALFFAAYGTKKRRDVERTRQQLQAEGFKTDIFQFETNYTQEAMARALAVLKIDVAADLAVQTDIRVPVYMAAGTFNLHTSNSVVVAWKEEFYSGAKKRSPWPAVYQTLEKRRLALDAAVATLLGEPVVFGKITDVDAEEREVRMDRFPISGRAIAVNVLCNLYYSRRADAWTNLIALTRMVSQSEVQPRDERSTRLTLVPIIYAVTWQALQDSAWTDQQLSTLEAEWAHADFFTRLPNSIAYTRACVSLDFENLRRPKADEHGITLDDLLKTPKLIPSVIKETAWMTWYRWGNSYDDERNTLLFLRDREVDLRRAIQATTILEMQKLPSVINSPSLTSKHVMDYPASIDVAFDFFESRPGGGARSFVGSLAYATDAEIRRRIMLTAIALERFKLRNAVYPEKLDQLTNAAPTSLIDFADGQPLQFNRTDDGHFFLYSIGLDCIDNGGDGRGVGVATNQVRMLRMGIPRNTDIIWPLPAHLPKPKPPEPEE